MIYDKTNRALIFHQGDLQGEKTFRITQTLLVKFLPRYLGQENLKRQTLSIKIKLAVQFEFHHFKAELDWVMARKPQPDKTYSTLDPTPKTREALISRTSRSNFESSTSQLHCKVTKRLGSNPKAQIIFKYHDQNLEPQKICSSL